MADTLAGSGDSSAGAPDAGPRRLPGLRLLELRAELRRRRRDAGGGGGLRERPCRAVKEEAPDPADLALAWEAAATRQAARRCLKGLKTEEGATEDNGLGSDDPADGQEAPEPEDSGEDAGPPTEPSDLEGPPPGAAGDRTLGVVADTCKSEPGADGVSDPEPRSGWPGGPAVAVATTEEHHRDGLASPEGSPEEAAGGCPGPGPPLALAVVKKEPPMDEQLEASGLDPLSPDPATPGVGESRVAAPEGSSAEQRASSLKEERDVKPVIKEERARLGAGSSQNLWVSGLSATTRATDLKNLFGKYGKVLGAKVVTNARSPGARCYGFVTMGGAAEAARCVGQLHRTELHGRMISVEQAKNEPTGRPPRDPDHDETPVPGHPPAAIKVEKTEATPAAAAVMEKRPEDIKQERGEPEPDGAPRAAPPGGRAAERTVVMDRAKGEPVVSVRAGGARERAAAGPEAAGAAGAGPQGDVLSFQKIKEQRERERQRQREREIREGERRREREQRERERRQEAAQERRERARLQRERLLLECQRQRLERERVRVERERRREQERIHREREELRRQQDQLRHEQERRARRDGAYWPDGRRPDHHHHHHHHHHHRFHEPPHRERPQYDHPADRRDGRRAPGERDGQHFPEERHCRDPQDSWGGYSSDKRLSEGRGPPPPRRSFPQGSPSQDPGGGPHPHPHPYLHPHFSRRY